MPVTLKMICSYADIPLPEGVIAPTEENDELRDETDAGPKPPKEKWTETGLTSMH